MRNVFTPVRHVFIKNTGRAQTPDNVKIKTN